MLATRSIDHFPGNVYIIADCRCRFYMVALDNGGGVLTHIFSLIPDVLDLKQQVHWMSRNGASHTKPHEEIDNSIDYDLNPFHKIALIGIISPKELVDLVDKGAERILNSPFKYTVVRITIDSPPNNEVCKLDILTELWEKGNDLQLPLENFTMPILLATDIRRLNLDLIKSVQHLAIHNMANDLFKLLRGLNAKRIQMATLKELVANGTDENDEPLMRHKFKIGKTKKYRRHYSVSNSASISCIKDKILRYRDNKLIFSANCIPYKFLDDNPVKWSELRKVLKCVADASEKDEYGQTVLHRAVKSPFCDADLIRSILTEGANINDRSYIGNTALLNAVRAPCVNEEVVTALLSSGADSNAKDSNGTFVLHHCVKNPDARASITKLLITFGANVNIRSVKERITPLQAALKYDADFEHIVELLKNGATLGHHYRSSALRTYLKCSHIKMNILQELLKYSYSIVLTDFRVVQDICNNIHCTQSIMEEVFRAFIVNPLDVRERLDLSRSTFRTGA
ncbi:ankyrin repeat protein [Nephila pilipes]|uniref:Ankyrin repeat protein n=1 Tax=Nephila pilipes TaxID=299642 RepID=A0A8X6UFM7_NEPPI|nr:ankyrin repeat protein [Nephila pilipes]